MKTKFRLFLIAVSFLTTVCSFSQLPNGSYGKDFNMQDYLGTSYNLYTYLDAGKPVIMDVSAVWCPPCWSHHTGGSLETYYNTYGPPGTNESMVFWIEGDQNSAACLQGTGCSTQGDWTAGTTFPMMLTVAPNNAQVVTDYAVAYFPTIYLICPDRKVTEVGQASSSQLHTAALGCPALSTTGLDASVFGAETPFAICGTFTPEVTIQNYGSTILTTCSVTVKLDGVTQSSVLWSGSLAKYEVDDVTLSQITGVSSGAHTLTYEITNPNSGTDEDNSNNTKTIDISGAMPIASTPLTEGFVNSVFPPADWIVDNPGNGETWARSATAGGFGNSTNSAFIDFYNIADGEIDDIYLLPVDLTGTSVASLTFSLAHKQYNATYSDDLKVEVSTNCGTSWTTAWQKSGSSLATVTGYTTSEYVPTSTHWRTETVNLNTYVGQSKVFVRFRATSGYGNDCYIDDINLSKTSAVNDISDQSAYLSVYPNPSSGNTAVEFLLPKSGLVNLSLCNLLGQQVISFGEKTYTPGNHTLYFSTETLDEGIYILNMVSGNQRYTQKVTVVK